MTTTDSHKREHAQTERSDASRQSLAENTRLAIRGVSKFFGKTKALSDINLDVAEGELCVLLGPSGCGKSTLLRIVAGLESPSVGKVLIEGNDVTSVAPGFRDIAMVFQNYALYPHMTVFENIAFPLRVRKFPPQDIAPRVEEVASLLQLNALLQRKPSQLSGGERQRVAMGRAIVRRPRVFLFDEPLSNLDTKLRANMRVEISLLHRNLGATTIYVTHDQVEAMTMADTIAVMDSGMIQQRDSPANVYHRPANLMVARFVGTPPMNLIPGALTRSPEDGQLHFSCFGTSLSMPPLPGCNKEGEATLGIRPEHVSLGRQGPWAGTVKFIEDVGSDRFVHLELPEGRAIVVRSRAGLDTVVGEQVCASPDLSRAHLFINGKRVGP